MNKYKKLREKRKSSGLCTFCGKHPIDIPRSRSRCQSCLNDRNQKISKMKATIQDGICTRCFKRNIDYSRSNSFCSSCLDYNLRYTKEYRHNHINELRAKERANSKKCSSKRRARQLGGGGSFSNEEWTCLIEKYNKQCLWCEKRKGLSADHIVPVSRGGSSYIENIQPLCGSCNSRKGVRILDFRQFGAGILDWT